MRKQESVTFSPATPPEQSARRERKKRTAPVWVAVVTGISGLVIGIAAAPGNSAITAEVTRLEQALAAAETQSEKATEELDSTQRALSEAPTTLQAQKERFEAETDELTRVHEEAVLAAEEATQLASEATLRAETAEAAATVSTNSAPRSFAEPPPAQPTGPVYANCTAAREAGGAPVYAGQPGYGPHLDRDGDGVGCE